MKIVKPETLVPIEWLWDYKDGERDIHVVDALDKSTVLFGIFLMDKFAKDCEKQLQVLLGKVETGIEIWNNYYPWSEYNGISLSLEKLESGIPFIYGQLCAENNVCREENVLLGLLTSLSKDLGPQVFIRLCDTDGDFIVNEISDTLPTKDEFPIACNRIWLNCGKLKLIPLQNSSRDVVRPEEALKFLEDSAFKLLDIDTLNSSSSAKTSRNFPTDVLSRLGKLPLVIDNERHRQILIENPRLISFLLKSLTDEELTVTDERPECETEPIELLVSKEHSDLIPYFFEAKGLSRNTKLIPTICGRAISKVIEKLLTERIIIVKEGTQQDKRTRCGTPFDLEKFPPASIDMALPTKENIDLTDDLVKNLKDLFSNEVTVDEYLEDDSSNEDSNEDIDEECRKYFQNEGIDIDEDDFLEFFLKEGLKLNDDGIEEVRNYPEL